MIPRKIHFFLMEYVLTVSQFVNTRANNERRLQDGAQLFQSMKGIRANGKA